MNERMNKTPTKRPMYWMIERKIERTSERMHDTNSVEYVAVWCCQAKIPLIRKNNSPALMMTDGQDWYSPSHPVDDWGEEEYHPLCPPHPEMEKGLKVIFFDWRSYVHLTNLKCVSLAAGISAFDANRRPEDEDGNALNSGTQDD